MSIGVIRDDDEVPGDCRGAIVAIGLFDGVHTGHRHLIARARRLAVDRHRPCGIVTFDRHPASVVRPETAPRVLTTLRHRLELFDGLGVDFARVVTFDEDRSLQPAADFATAVLVDELAVSGVVVGEGFHFGSRRAGDVDSLRAMAEASGFDLQVVAPVSAGGAAPAVSSNAIREHLATGDVAGAARLLGRPYEVRGIVEHGDQRGRSLGYPTANVAVGGDVMLPADGVYAGSYRQPDGTEWPAAVSVGRRPTFYRDNGLLLVEAHLLDYDGDLYGQRTAVRITQFIRGQERFDSAADLVAQMDRDIVAIREVGSAAGSCG